MSKVDNAVELFNKGYNCAQAICTAYGVEMGLKRKNALKVSNAFGGGMARLGSTCGAVTGALMVIGLRFGQSRLGDIEAKERTYEIANRFIDEFKKQSSSIVCKELLGYDLSTPEGYKAVIELGLRQSHCTRYIKSAAEILERLIEIRD